jgi:hypothetical protein
MKSFGALESAGDSDLITGSRTDSGFGVFVDDFEALVFAIPDSARVPVPSLECAEDGMGWDGISRGEVEVKVEVKLKVAGERVPDASCLS